MICMALTADVVLSLSSSSPFSFFLEAFHVLELGFKLLSNVFNFSLIKWLLCSQMTEGDV